MNLETIIPLMERALCECPCCGASTRATSGPEDGITPELAFEIEFFCDARVGLAADGSELVPLDGCPTDLGQRLMDLFDEVTCDDE